MAPQWTPQMAENLRSLMKARNMTAEDLRRALSYASVAQAHHLMTATEPYRPDGLRRSMLADAFPPTHIDDATWSLPADKFERWAERPLKQERPSGLWLWWRQLSDRLGFRGSQERRKGRALAQQPEARGSSPRSCDSPNAKGERR